MKNIAILTIALLLSLNTTYALSNTSDNPTATSKTEEKKSTKETDSDKSEVKKTTKIINGADLHKLKFPKKFGSKKTKYNFRK